MTRSIYSDLNVRRFGSLVEEDITAWFGSHDDDAFAEIMWEAHILTQPGSFKNFSDISGTGSKSF